MKQRFTGKFGLLLCEDNVDSDMFITGKLHHLESPPSYLQQEKEQEEKEKDDNDGVEVTKEEVLEVLSQFGYELGPQFQAFKDIKLGSYGRFCKWKEINYIIFSFSSICV